jgi:hypothetical protein
VLARREIAPLYAPAELAFLLCIEQRDLVDLQQVGLEAAFGRNGVAPVKAPASG